ncbi:hypothetical protein ACFYO2_20270 [Streptomyces sp. NPDC006602]|uniref:hypothetical protein n=1 Tax=Streptomyces sp. NPDC006602 TaxID=3364751 RepID=UPI0036C60EE1
MIDRLVKVTHWEPRRAEVSWGETEERLGLSLPEDYKRLAAVFGKGRFSDFLQILSVAPGGAFDLATTWQSLSTDAPVEGDDPLYAPYRMYRPGQVGLIPWGFGHGHTRVHSPGGDGPRVRAFLRRRPRARAVFRAGSGNRV